MTVEDCRAEMASIDNELLRLLNRRARLARRLGSPAADALDRACRANAGPLDEISVARIFRRIIRETRHAEPPPDAPDRRARPAAPHEEVGELV